MGEILRAGDFARSSGSQLSGLGPCPAIRSPLGGRDWAVGRTDRTVVGDSLPEDDLLQKYLAQYNHFPRTPAAWTEKRDLMVLPMKKVI